MEADDLYTHTYIHTYMHTHTCTHPYMQAGGLFAPFIAIWRLRPITYIPTYIYAHIHIHIHIHTCRLVDWLPYGG